MKRKTFMVLFIAVFLLVGFSPSVFARASKTQYPVVFAHGSFGFDEVFGMYYFGDDYGTFVGDPCDCLFESKCNRYINRSQKAYATKVWAFQSSEERGYSLCEQIKNIMAIENTSHVNIIGHSQGGVDARKAARLLREEYDYTVVNVLASISSNHRGCRLGKSGMDIDENDPGLYILLDLIFENFYGDVVLQMPGNDLEEMFKGVMYDDYYPDDDEATGLKAYNQNYPVSPDYASLYVSFMTAQNGISRNPLLSPFIAITGDIDGDGYCVGDCDGDGEAGCGDGNPYNRDDDGLVGLSTQQMGWRMKYYDIPFFFDFSMIDEGMGYVGDINNPSSEQMTSLVDVMNADHFDPIFLGPDLFDEMEFYASIIDFIADNE